MGLTTLLLAEAFNTALLIATPANSAVPGEVLVRYRDTVAGVSVRRAFSAATLRAQPVETNARLGFTRLRLPSGTDVVTAIAQLRKDPNVLYAEPNYLAHKDVTPDDTFYNSSIQWPLFKIEAATAWNYALGTGVKVAVLDTGVQANHPDLVGKVVLQYDFAYNDPVANDVDGHGTHTAGTVGATTYNATGVASLGYNVQLLCGKVLDDTGSGSHAAIANGIVWATDNGAKVINMSLGGSSGSSTLQNAVNYATTRGVLVVASAGNAGNTRANYPAYYSNALAVAATDRNDARATFSTYGSWVDLAAPGVDIASTYIGSQYVYMSGTSMAAPHVSALAGLVFGTSYGTSASAVRTRLINTGDNVTTRFGSYPLKRINARKAVLPATP
jgi:thermitase